MAVQLFIPCYVDQYTPQVARALCQLLDYLGIAWTYPATQTCCGQFAYNAGDWTSARRLMRHFFTVFNRTEAIICPSASCVLTVRCHYPSLIETPHDADHLQHLQPLVLEFSEWLFSILPLPYSPNFPGKVLLHQSCAARQLGSLPKMRHILSTVSQLELLEMPSSYACCGFGGLFSVKRPDLSQAIGLNYLTAARSTGAEALVSPDVGCLLHLQGLLQARGLTWPLYHLSELLLQTLQYC
ncbi:(Fe-S)-binding protein [Desulfobacca acetoxidans]